MRKFFLSFLTLTMAFSFNSCEEKKTEEERSIQLQMELSDSSIQIGDVIETEQGSVTISDFKIYLSDIYVHYAGGDSSLWTEVVLIDFEENKSLKNIFNPVRSSQVIAVSGGVGIRPELNEGVDPSEFVPEHPLSFQSSNGMHWGWETGYKFLVFDAVADTGSGNFDWPISYHIGTSELYKRFKINVDEEDGSLIFVEDVERLFSEDVLNMTITQSPQTHTINNEEVAEKFRDAFINSLSIK